MPRIIARWAVDQRKPAKKRSLQSVNLQTSIFCGAAGSRTRVQTSSKTAFYMLSFQLIVGKVPAKSHPTLTLFPLIFELPSGLRQPYPSFFDALERDAGW